MNTHDKHISAFNFANSTMTPIAAIRPSNFKQEFMHLTALNAFALAQPILDRLAANTLFLKGCDYSGTAVLVSIGLILTAIPVSVLLTIAVLRWRGRSRSAKVVLGVATGLLSVMSLLVLTRWISVSLDLMNAGVPDSAMAIFAVSGGLLSVRLYFRSGRFRQILSLCAVGVILFPLNFFSTVAIREHVLGISSQQESLPGTALNPAPVVMIVFDGLCGMALLNEEHEIDRSRYPSFARLADTSSFYRNATTVHPRTHHALPAILSSCIPEEHQRPVEADYPTNLFRLIYETGQYDMSVFEPYTHFCSEELVQIHKSLSLTEQTGLLLNTLMRVYTATTLPRDWKSMDGTIPHEWFGIFPREVAARGIRDGQIVYGWDSWRGVQCEHFVECLDRDAKPGFRFLHVVVPHDPWNMLPSGKSYARISRYEESNFGSINEQWCKDPLLVHLAWQRYLLQVQFADLWLGRILDRLEETGQLDEALIVVTADHGMAFVPGTGRRTPTAATLPDIASVPLFIKQPGQHNAVVSDKNVETIDILPTMTEILGLPDDSAWDGVSVLHDGPQRPRKMIRDPDTIIEPDFPQRFQYVDRMIRVFGSGSNHDRLWNLNTIPELVGQDVGRVAVGPAVNYQCRLSSGGTEFDPQYPNYVPCYFQGTLSDTSEHSRPKPLALALNGVILATTRTSTDASFLHEWAILLPDSAFRQEGNRVQLFEVETRDQTHMLHEIPIDPTGS